MSARECPAEKILGFGWSKTAQMAFKFLCFFRNIVEYVQDFSCPSKQFLRTFFFLQRLFPQKIQKNFQFKMKTSRPYIIFYINSFSGSTNTAAPHFILLIGNINIRKVPKCKAVILC